MAVFLELVKKVVQSELLFNLSVRAVMILDTSPASHSHKSTLATSRRAVSRPAYNAGGKWRGKSINEWGVKKYRDSLKQTGQNALMTGNAPLALSSKFKQVKYTGTPRSSNQWHSHQLKQNTPPRQNHVREECGYCAYHRNLEWAREQQWRYGCSTKG